MTLDRKQARSPAGAQSQFGTRRYARNASITTRSALEDCRRLG